MAGKNDEDSMRVAVVVLGDLGRSPRMQYHAHALACSGAQVDLVGYAGSALHDVVRQHSRIACRFLRPPWPSSRHRGSPTSFLLHSIVRLATQSVQLLRVLLFSVQSPDVVLLQNPPSVPTLLIGLVAARLRSARLIIDWHNLGYTMLALRLGKRHPIVRLSRWYERSLARFADAHLCVSRAMQEDLANRWDIHATLVYDRPSDVFMPTPVHLRHDLFRRLHDSFVDVPGRTTVESIRTSPSEEGAGLTDPPIVPPSQGGTALRELLSVPPPCEETVDKCEDTLRRAQGERRKSFEIKPPTAQAELVEALFRRKSTVSEEGGLRGIFPNDSISKSPLTPLLRRRSGQVFQRGESVHVEDDVLREDTIVTRLLVPRDRLHDDIREYCSTTSSAADQAGPPEALMPFVHLRPDRPALIVSSTGWTADEDFDLLLDAVLRCQDMIKAQETISPDRAFPRLLILITGKGPLREHYERQIRKLALRTIQLHTLWLSPQDYARLLGAADLGLCLHRSSSGVDLPMKVADMFGAGLPVCAFDYGPCLAEQVRHGENGLVFSTGDQLARLLYDLFKGFPNHTPTLDRLRRNVEQLRSLHWVEAWRAEAASVFFPSGAGGDGDPPRRANAP